MNKSPGRKTIAVCAAAVAVVVMFFQAAAAEPDNIYPTKGWLTSTPEAQGMRSSVLADMMAYINKNRFDIDSITIVRNGHMVLDTYFWPFAKNRKHLFGPLGITDINWSASPRGVDVGYGEMWLKPHDMARFGWLYLNKGQWAGRQILPADWVAASIRGHIAAVPFDEYGYQWWIDSGGYYMAVGYKGQRIFVVPEKNMVSIFQLPSSISPRACRWKTSGPGSMPGSWRGSVPISKSYPIGKSH